MAKGTRVVGESIITLIDTMLVKVKEFRNVTTHMTAVVVTFDPEMKNEESFQRDLKEIERVIVKDLSRLALTATTAIQRVTAKRAEIGKYAPGNYAIQTLDGGFREPEVQPAIDQLTSRIIPIIKQRSKVVTNRPGKVTRGFAAYTDLENVKITDLVSSKAPTGAASTIADSDAMKAARTSPQLHERDVAGRGTIKGGRGGHTTGSDYIDTWQILEYGTGVYAEHPDFGWGPRLTGDSKVDISRYTTRGDSYLPSGGSPFETTSERSTAQTSLVGGAWYLNPKSKSPTILGQKGGHFLFGLPGSSELDAMDYKAAMNAIQQFLDRRFGKLRTIVSTTKG